MNNRDVFVSDSIILANIFVVEQGDSIGRKLERPPTKFNIYGMIGTSRKVNSLAIFGIPSKI